MSDVLVAIPDGMSEEGVKYLLEHGINIIPKKDSQRIGIDALAQQADAIVVRSATKVMQVPEEPRVKIYGRIGSGVDNFSDARQQIDKAGIPIVNSPEPNAISVSELVFSYLLDDARGIQSIIDSSRRGEWAKDRYQGSRLHGKTLGIVGVGLIGANVANIGNAFGMKVLAYDIRPNLSLPNVKFVPDLDTLLKESDYVTVHTPYSNKPLFGKKEFKLMKTSAVFIQTARGGIADEADLVEALEKGQIRKAYIDVFTTEPFDGSRGRLSESLGKLIQLSNAYCTSHIGASTEEGQREGSLIIAKRLTNYLLYGYLDSMCNGNIDSSLNNLRVVFHRAGMFIGQYSQDDANQVKVLLDGELRTSDETTKSQLLNTLMTGLFFSGNRYVNSLNLENVVGNTKYSISNVDRRRDNTFTVEVEGKKSNYTIEFTYDTGELVKFGYGHKIAEIEPFSTRFELNGNLAIIIHDDKPGALAVVADRIAREDINIANASTDKQLGGKAVSVFQLESTVANGLLNGLIGESPVPYRQHRIKFHSGISIGLPPKNAF